MKKLKFLSVLFACGLLFAHCGGTCGGDKTSFLKNFTQFVQEKSDKSHNDSRDRLFRQYIKECYPLHETQMSVGDKKDFWVGVLRYYYQRYGLNMITELSKEKDLREVLIKGLKEIGLNLENINIADIIRLL